MRKKLAFAAVTPLHNCVLEAFALTLLKHTRTTNAHYHSVNGRETQSQPRRILLPVIYRRHCSLGLAQSEPHPRPLRRPHYVTPSQPPGSGLFRAPRGEDQHSLARRSHLQQVKVLKYLVYILEPSQISCKHVPRRTRHRASY